MISFNILLYSSDTQFDPGSSIKACRWYSIWEAKFQAMGSTQTFYTKVIPTITKAFFTFLTVYKSSAFLTEVHHDTPVNWQNTPNHNLFLILTSIFHEVRFMRLATHCALNKWLPYTIGIKMSALRFLS